MNKTMFANHEALRCEDCGMAFMGRRPADGGTAFCSACWNARKAPIVTETDDIPSSVLEEHDLRGGESGAN